MELGEKTKDKSACISTILNFYISIAYMYIYVRRHSKVAISKKF